MARMLEKDEYLVQVGAMAYRNDDGSFQPSKPVYVIEKQKNILPSGLTKGEEEICEEFAKTMAVKFKQYVDKTKI